MTVTAWRDWLQQLSSPSTRRRRRSRRPSRRRPIRYTMPVSVLERLEDRTLLSAVSTTALILPTGFADDPIVNLQPVDAPNAATPSGVTPIGPAQMQAAYGVNLINFNGTPGNGSGQTIAIVDAYNNPTIVSDMTTFNSTFHLQQFNVAGGPTFSVVNQTGGPTLPANALPGDWDAEEALDVQWAHSIAPEANIVLYEATTNAFTDLYTAVDTARHNPAVSVVSMSFGGNETSGETTSDTVFTTPSSHQGVTFLASTNDHKPGEGPASYPAFSSNVVAVGGTTLGVNFAGGYGGETGWSSGGGGISQFESQPAYQVGNIGSVVATTRTVPDVSMEGDPDTGVYVLDTYASSSFGSSWLQYGGTSLATPMWAGLIATADQGRTLSGLSTLDGPTQTLPMLYSLPSSNFHDVIAGNNGFVAGPGYDLVTGRGTPIANDLVPHLAGLLAGPPNVTPATTTLNTQTTSGLVVTPNATDGLATNFQITNITGGTLYKHNGTPINNGDFITLAEGSAGLFFTPTFNSTANGTFNVQESETANVTGLSGGTATATVTVSTPPVGTWTSLGPAAIAGDPQTDAPLSGRITGIAASPTDANTIYIASAGGGVWKTTDGGTHWIPLTDNQPTLAMGAISIAPSNSQVIYAGTGESNNTPDSQFGDGVLVSLDGGATWNLTGTTTFLGAVVAKIAVDPSNAAIAYVAVSNFRGGVSGVFKTTDSGQNWALLKTDSNEVFSDVAINPSNPSIVYAAEGAIFGATTNGVYESTDAGATWAAAGNFPMGATDGRITIAIAPSNPSTIYASIAYPSNLGLLEMMKSTDGGATWSKLVNTPNYMANNGSAYQSLAVSPTNPNVVFAGGAPPTGVNNPSGMIESTDGGASWTDIGSAGTTGVSTHPGHHAAVFDANGVLLDGNDGGIFRLDNPSTSGWTWSDLNGDLSITQFNAVAVDPTNPGIAYGGGTYSGTEKYTGSSVWNLLQGGQGGSVQVDPNNPLTVYHELSYQAGFFQRSDDGGLTWTNITTGITVPGGGAAQFPPFVIDPANSNRLLLGTNRVYESLDQGNTWTPISTPSTTPWPDNTPILALAAYGNTIYAATSNHIYVTTNDGSTWVETTPTTGVLFGGLWVNPTNPQVAYAITARTGVGNHIFATTDGGAHWTDVSNNLPPLAGHAIVGDPTTGTIYVGLDNGVYSSTDNGAHWARLGAGLPNVQVLGLQLSPNGNMLAAATYGRGMWTIPVSAALSGPPIVTGAATTVNAQTISGLTIAPSSADAPFVNFFQITQIQGGTLFLSNGTTQVLEGGFISVSDAAAGLKFTPFSNSVFAGHFTVQESTTNTLIGLSGLTATATITIAPAPIWNNVSNAIPQFDGAQLALLLPNGSVMVHGSGGGNQGSAAWYLLTPDSTGGYANGTWIQLAPMHVSRLYFASVVLPDGRVFVVGGEYSSDGGDSSSGEIYNPATNTWTVIPNSPKIVGDDPAELLPDGRVLVGDLADNGTQIFNPLTMQWAQGATKIRNDQSDEESWIKLPNGNILTYDLFASINLGTGVAEEYVPQAGGLGTWIDASDGNLPVLSSAALGYELGPGVLLPDGRVFITGANNLTAFFNTQTSTWSPGPPLPAPGNTDGSQADAPAAVLPNGDVLLATSPLGSDPYTTPTAFFEFNPSNGNTTPYIYVSPSLNVLDTTGPTYVDDMLVLPTGQVMVTNFDSAIALYTPSGNPDPSWAPTITGGVDNHDGTFTLTGARLSGINEGAAYGDDNQMASNYPLIQITDNDNGKIYYATSFGWTSTGVSAPGDTTPQHVQFKLPTAALGSDSFSYKVVTNGIASPLVAALAGAPNVTPATTTTNTQTNAGLMITPHAGDIDVNFFQITGVSNGTLYLNNGTTAVAAGSFITAAQALQGLKFTPNNGFQGVGHFTVQESTSNSTAGLAGATQIANIAVSVPVTGPPNVTNATTNANVQSTSGLMITPAAGDTAAVAYFQITHIMGGMLFLNDGTTAVNEGDFITVADGAAGLKFTPFTNSLNPGHFTVEESTSNTLSGLGGATAIATITVNATGAHLVFTQQPAGSVMAGAAIPVTVEIEDVNGNLITSDNSTVTLAVDHGPGTLQPTPPVTAQASGGIATFSSDFLTTVGTYTLVAMDGSDQFQSSTSFTVTAGTAHQLAITQGPSNGASGVAILPAIIVSVEDQFGNLVTTDSATSVSLVKLTGPGVIGGSFTVTDTNGIAAFSNVIFAMAGNYTIGAQASGLTNAPASSQFTIVPGTPAKLVFTTQPTDTVAGASIDPSTGIVVAIEDQNNNVITTDNSSVTLAVFTGPGQLQPPASTTVQIVNGYATFTGLSLQTAGSYTLKATDPSVPPATGNGFSSSFNITPDALDHLAFIQQPTNVGAGVNITPAITVVLKDQFNNTINDSAATVSLAINSGPSPNTGFTVTSTVSVNPVNGIATFSNVGLGTAGTYTLIANVGAATSPVSQSFIVSAGTANKLVFVTEPSNTVAGSAITPPIVVDVDDAFGNLVATDNSNVTLSVFTGPNLSALEGSTTVQAMGGIATFSGVYIRTEGTYTLQATDSTLASSGLSQFPLPITNGVSGTLLGGITAGPGGNIWFSEYRASAYNTTINLNIGYLTATGVFNEFSFLGNLTAPGIAVGADGYLYVPDFIGSGTQQIGQMTPAGIVTGFTIQTPNSNASVIVAGSDGNLWFNEPGTTTAPVGKIGRITTAGVATEFTLPTPNSDPTDLAAGPDGNIWFTEVNANKIGRITPAGGILEFSLPAGDTLTSSSSISGGPDGNVWFTGKVGAAGAVFQISPTTGTITAFVDPLHQPLAITTGPDGNLWFTDADASGGTGWISRITPSGAITDFSVPSVAANNLLGITTGADGNIWFTDKTSHRIDEFKLPISSVPTGVTAAISTSFVISAGAASQVAFVQQPSNGTAGIAISPAVTVAVEDQFGNVVTTDNSNITIAVNSFLPVLGSAPRNDPTFIPVSTTAGIATFGSLAFTTAGNYTLSATDSNASLPSTVSSSFLVSAGNASQLVFVRQPTTTGAGNPVNSSAGIGVAFEDQYGNVVTSNTSPVTLVKNTGPQSLTVPNVNAVNGVANFTNVVFTTIGQYTLKATYGTPVPQLEMISNLFSIIPGASDHLAFIQQPTNAIAGAVISPAITVAIEDTYNNVITTDNSSISLSVQTGPGTLKGTLSAVASGGVGTFNNVDITTAGNYKLKATEGGIIGTSSSFTISPAPAFHLITLQQPTTVTAGSAITPAVRISVQDQYGNIETNDTSPITLAVSLGPPGSVLNGTTTVAAVGGVATFNGLSLNVATQYAFSISSAGLPIAGTVAFNVLPGPASQLAFHVEPTSAATGHPLPLLVVYLEDGFGNLVAIDGSVVDMAVASGPGPVTGSPNVGSIKGGADFANLIFATAGTYTLQASDGLLASAVSTSFVITGGTASQAAFATAPKNAAAGATMAAVVASIKDSSGNAVSSGTATLSIASGPAGATLGGTTTVSIVKGSATFSNLVLTKAGAYTFRVTSGAATTTSVSFTITPGAATQLIFTSQATTGILNTRLATSVVITAEDKYGNVATNSAVSVNVSVNSGPSGGKMGGTQSARLTNGVATFSTLSFNKVGSYTLKVTSTGLTQGLSKAISVTS